MDKLPRNKVNLLISNVYSPLDTNIFKEIIHRICHTPPSKYNRSNANKYYRNHNGTNIRNTTRKKVLSSIERGNVEFRRIATSEYDHLEPKVRIAKYLPWRTSAIDRACA